MPLFHSNSMFVGLMPASGWAARSAIRERFSASSFVPDCFGYGVTGWNYVGEPVHYILTRSRSSTAATRRGSCRADGEPENRCVRDGQRRVAPDIDRFTRWMGLEDMFELYGSTEAAISTLRTRATRAAASARSPTPRCASCARTGGVPPGRARCRRQDLELRHGGRRDLRVSTDTGLFQGYFDNPEANSSKYRDGMYHSGDLGHVLEHDGKRFLFFDGRTDDWIRKDGENFSALQVARCSRAPRRSLAAAYGVPCAVSDELVMAALSSATGAEFDPKGFFDFCERQIWAADGPQVVPDFVRIVGDFEYTGTRRCWCAS